MIDNATSESRAALSSGQIGVADVFRAIGHPIRVDILRTLAKGGQVCCGELVDTLPLAQSTVSQHLGVLKAVGLVRCEIHGRCCRYSLHREAIGEYSAMIAELFSALTQESPNLARTISVDIAAPAKGEKASSQSNACLPRRKDLP